MTQISQVTNKSTRCLKGDGHVVLLKLQGAGSFPRGMESKIKTNPLIFLCQVITVCDKIQIEIVATGCDSVLLTARVTGGD